MRTEALWNSLGMPWRLPVTQKVASCVSSGCNKVLIPLYWQHKLACLCLSCTSLKAAVIPVFTPIHCVVRLHAESPVCSELIGMRWAVMMIAQCMVLRMLCSCSAQCFKLPRNNASISPPKSPQQARLKRLSSPWLLQAPPTNPLLWGTRPLA